MAITFLISGQYTGEQKPLPEYHARIAGFDERVSENAGIFSFFLAGISFAWLCYFLIFQLKIRYN